MGVRPANPDATCRLQPGGWGILRGLACTASGLDRGAHGAPARATNLEDRHVAIDVSGTVQYCAGSRAKCTWQEPTAERNQWSWPVRRVAPCSLLAPWLSKHDREGNCRSSARQDSTRVGGRRGPGCLQPYPNLGTLSRTEERVASQRCKIRRDQAPPITDRSADWAPATWNVFSPI
jgi:hypothetical protein